MSNMVDGYQQETMTSGLVPLNSGV